MLDGMYLVQVSLLFIGQQGLGHFFRYRPLLPIGWRIVQILRQRWRKTRTTAPTTLSAIQAASQSTFINANFTPFVINRNDKNKQITCKFVETSKKILNRCDAYSCLYLSIYVIQSPKQLVRQSL